VRKEFSPDGQKYGEGARQEEHDGRQVHLFERVLLQWIDTAQTAKSVWEAGHLLTCPIIFSFHLTVFIIDRRPVRVPKVISQGEHGGPTDAALVQQPD
jgi:hypothetical protein